jgi:hydrogenase expression/formation protein HypC
MCLSIPGTVVRIEENAALVDIGGAQCEAATHLVDDCRVGDRVLVHSGYILEKLDTERADDMLAMLQSLAEHESDTTTD